MTENRYLKILISLLIPLVISFLFPYCSDPEQPANSTKNLLTIQDSVINYHKKVIHKEDQEIADYIQRYHWRVTTQSTGLRYMIYKHGTGAMVKSGKTVTINYSVSLLDGKLCYSSNTLGSREFQVGHGGVETGLEDGILLLREGDRAKFIVPSHLAFGLLGDQDKIPPLATLIYDVELIKLK